jgi:hypothetical protein
VQADPRLKQSGSVHPPPEGWRLVTGEWACREGHGVRNNVLVERSVQPLAAAALSGGPAVAYHRLRP